MNTNKRERHSHSLSLSMPGLSYPFRYVCFQCGETTTITRSDADEVHSNPDTSKARQMVLQ